MIRSTFIAVFSFAAGVLVYDTALDNVKSNIVARDTVKGAVFMPAPRVDELRVNETLSYPINCSTWVAQRGPNESWRIQCTGAGDLTLKGKP